jgi:hypothetical protein
VVCLIPSSWHLGLCEYEVARDLDIVYEEAVFWVGKVVEASLCKKHYLLVLLYARHPSWLGFVIVADFLNGSHPRGDARLQLDSSLRMQYYQKLRLKRAVLQCQNGGAAQRLVPW